MACLQGLPPAAASVLFSNHADTVVTKFHPTGMTARNEQATVRIYVDRDANYAQHHVSNDDAGHYYLQSLFTAGQRIDRTHPDKPDQTGRARVFHPNQPLS